ncbi:MAG: Nif3-like dinuclear metal center hexameric protein [Frankiales bacterium]|nr:Nif3-like dinuclear metal center hexameric protein [Frankiales bacterium]
MLLSEVVAALEADWPARLAADWDAVGLVAGDPRDEVQTVLFAVDPTEATVAEALDLGADLLVTHHPLFLRGTSSVAATTAKGRMVHALVRGHCALLAAHTNADSAVHGVNDSLAALFDLRDTVPLEPHPGPPLLKLGVYVPVLAADELRDALADAGAGRVGDYDRCSWSAAGQGTFRPLPGARPTVGSVGESEAVAEERVEVVVRPADRAAVLAALRAAHPYETPAYDLVTLLVEPAGTGMGRVGDLPAPMPLAELVELAARVLPRTAWGVRGAGAPDAIISRLAVCGGAGDSLMAAAAEAGAQAYLTSDLRHHPASDRPEGLALLDAAHWATEWPWLPVAAERLAAATGLTTRVSRLVTDPFPLHSKGPA